MSYGRRLWEINMRVEVIDHFMRPMYQFTWNIRDAVGGQVSNQAQVTPEALDYCIVEPSYLMAHCNEQFHKFYQEKGKGFAEILAQTLADYQRRVAPPGELREATELGDIDKIIEEANDDEQTDV